MLSLKGHADEGISKILGIKRQNAGKRLAAAQWDMFQAVMKIAENEFAP